MQSVTVQVGCCKQAIARCDQGATARLHHQTAAGAFELAPEVQMTMVLRTKNNSSN